VAQHAQTMSRAEVIAELRRLSTAAGTTLLATDLPYDLWLAVRRHFGSIEKARVAAGLGTPDRARRWSKSKVVAELRRLHAEGVRITDLGLKHEHGEVLGALRMYFDSIVVARRVSRIPEPVPLGGKRQRWDEIRVVAEIEELHRSGASIAASKVPNPLFKAGKRYFGSWQGAVEAAGHDYDEVRLQREPYTKKEILEALQALAKSQPEMRWSDLHQLSYAPTVTRLFGGFEVALQRAKLRAWPERERHAAMSRPDVIAEIQRREAQGKETNWEAVNTDDHRLWYSGVLHFGEWHRAIEVAGVDAERHNRRWTSESLLEALAERDRRGLSLKPDDVRRDDSRLYASTIAYFGSYVEAVQQVAPTPWALTKWTRSMVIERLKALAGDRDRVTAREAGGTLVAACQRHFGTYSAACRAAGVNRRARVRSY